MTKLLQSSNLWKPSRRMSDWSEIVKIAVRPRYSLVIWCFCALILLVPLPSFLCLGDFRRQYAPYLGVIFLLSFAVWLVEISIFVSERIIFPLFEKRKRNRVLKDYLSTLNPSEKYLLARALSKNQQTISHDVFSEEAASLVSKGLLVKVPSEVTHSFAPFTVPPFAWKHLVKQKTAFIAEANQANPRSLQLTVDSL